MIESDRKLREDAEAIEARAQGSLVTFGSGRFRLVSTSWDPLVFGLLWFWQVSGADFSQSGTLTSKVKISSKRSNIRSRTLEPLVPYLEEISWDKIVGHNFEESTIEDMIRSRWRPAGQLPAVASFLKIARLGSIAICCGNPSFSSVFIAHIRDCIEDGNILVGRSRS